VVDVGYQKLVVVSFKIEADLLAELDAIARSKNMNRSEVIRRAIVGYLKAFSRPSVTPRMTIYDATMPRVRIR
jgi:metal-responsive CopG/Arc/MetJ family transcriptional regulator